MGGCIMKYKWFMYGLLGCCVCVVLAIMAGLSIYVLVSEYDRVENVRQVRLVEQSRLALWRMDSLLSAMFVAENNRAPKEFLSAKIQEAGKKEEGEKAQGLEDFAVLYFQIAPDGVVTSPQQGEERDLRLARVKQWHSKGVLKEYQENVPQSLPIPLALLEEGTDQEAEVTFNESNTKEEKSQSHVALNSVIEQVSKSQALDDYAMRMNSYQEAVVVPEDSSVRSRVSRFSKKELTKKAVAKPSKRLAKKKRGIPGAGDDIREKVLPSVSMAPIPQSVPADYAVMPDAIKSEESVEFSPAPSAVVIKSESPTQESELIKPTQLQGETSISPYGAVWTPEGECVLIRRVSEGAQVWLQGIWLDWSILSKFLLSSIQDIFPEARLEPCVSDEVDFSNLAGLPARLVPLNCGLGGDVSDEVLYSLLLAWGCGILALGGLGGFFIGVIRLSERRAIFVSAVSHELRTPLTTFNLYTEMLEAGMVPVGEEKSYLSTLRRESSRLMHLVNNVLSYSRVERNKISLSLEKVALHDLIKAAIERISGRLNTAGMDSSMRFAPDLEHGMVLVDRTAFEQIVYNLADNAVKYAGQSGTILHIDVERERKSVLIRITDEGNGISKKLRRRLFRPFSRSAEEAAGKQPGVGLGLALSRQLARKMKGDLRCEEVDKGACFVIKLPLFNK